MNTDQIARQVKYLLQAAVWADAAQVFASESVMVSLGMAAAVAAEKRLPFALIRPGSETPHEEQPSQTKIEFTVTVVVSNQGDQYGEAMLIGAHRGAGSVGRGLLEVEARVKSALVQIGAASGVPILFRGAGAAAASQVEGLGYVVWRDYRFAAEGTIVETYQAPSGLVRTGTTTAILAWNASPRFDFYGFVLRRASGATPPATIADGTGVTLSSITATSKTDTPGAGTYSYSLFAQYDDTSSGAAVATSAPQTLVSVVVS